MSQPDERPRTDVPDEDLPPDLVPADDNPLAEGLPAGETVEGLLEPDEDENEDEEQVEEDREAHQAEGA